MEGFKGVQKLQTPGDKPCPMTLRGTPQAQRPYWGPGEKPSEREPKMPRGTETLALGAGSSLPAASDNGSPGWEPAERQAPAASRGFAASSRFHVTACEGGALSPFHR